MTKTVVINNVPAADKKLVEDDLRADGYKVTSQPEDDGEFTIIGTKTVADPQAEIASRRLAVAPVVRSARKKKRNP